MRRTRVIIGVAGIMLGLFGIFRLVTQISLSDLVVLGLWMIGALVIHDGILSPLVVAVGTLVSRLVPPRARRYVAAGLIMSGCVIVIAIPMIYRRNSQPRSKAILQQNFGGNLALLLGLIAALSLAAYAVHVARDQRRADRPPRAD